MRRPLSYFAIFVTFLSFLSMSLAACKHQLFPSTYFVVQHPNLTSAPTSFCKCTCFGNSTIVALDAPSPKKPVNPEPRPRANKKSCNDCNRQFCLGYNFCAGEKEENVLTTCFQRDSTKDQAVVFIFIAATVGLLGWAGVRPWVDGWREVCTYSCTELDWMLMMRCRKLESGERTSRSRGKETGKS